MPTTAQVKPLMASGGNLTVTTGAGGTSYVTFGSQACVRLTIINASGQTIEFQRGGAGAAVQIPNGGSASIEGITNASQIGVRRYNAANASEVVGAMWEA